MKREPLSPIYAEIIHPERPEFEFEVRRQTPDDHYFVIIEDYDGGPQPMRRWDWPLFGFVTAAVIVLAVALLVHAHSR